MLKSFRGVIASSVILGLALSAGCAKVPSSNASSVKQVPLPQEVDEIDSSKLVPSADRQNCRNAPSVAKAVAHDEQPLIGGGTYGTYDWAPGVTNGGQIWKTRLAYSKSSLSQVNLVPTFTQIGNVSDQRKLAKKVNSVAYINGDFFHLRGTNELFRAMVENGQLVYAPKIDTKIVGVVEDVANEHTGLQGASHIKAGAIRITTQGLNLEYLGADSIGAYNSLKTTTGLPSVQYVVEATNGVVTKSGAANTFAIPTDSNSLVFVASGAGVSKLQKLRVGESVSYVKPTNAKAIHLLRTGLTANGTVTLPDGKSFAISSVNDRTARVKNSSVLFTSRLYPSTSALDASVVTDLSGTVTKLYNSGHAVNVGNNELVLQTSGTAADLVRNLKVGDKLKIVNNYKIKKDLPLAAAFGDAENTMINGVIVANCSPGHEDIRPRTAIGWNENGDVWFVTTTMGVRNAADIFNRFRVGGSTVHQLTQWLKELGATQAVAVDGGGSTTMYVKQPTNDFKRVDLPETEWVRPVPQGITMVPR